MEREIRRETGRSKKEVREVTQIIIVALFWYAILMWWFQGCSFIQKPDPMSQDFYKQMYEQCHENNLELIELSNECEEDLTICKKLGTSLEGCH